LRDQWYGRKYQCIEPVIALGRFFLALSATLQCFYIIRCSIGTAGADSVSHPRVIEFFTRIEQVLMICIGFRSNQARTVDVGKVGFELGQVVALDQNATFTKALQGIVKRVCDCGIQIFHGESVEDSQSQANFWKRLHLYVVDSCHDCIQQCTAPDAVGYRTD